MRGINGRIPSRVKLAVSVAAVMALSACASNRVDETTAARPQAAVQPMNVLFIVSDDLRVGGAFGDDSIRTPNIDRLAKRGVAFDRAYSQYPLCGPSRASFLSGMRPNSIRVYDLSTHVRSNVPDVTTLPQYFRQNGYFTARVGKLFHQGVPGEIGRIPDRHDDPNSWNVALNPAGFDKRTEHDGSVVNLTPPLPLGIAFAYREDESPDEIQTDGLVATRTIELLKENKDKPFFIAAGFYRPHVPEVAPKRYFDQYRAISYSPEKAVNTASVLPAARGPAYTYIDRQAEALTPEEKRDFVRSYYAATTFMDAQLGRILNALEESGVADRTIVVFTSDHGFNLGEHGSWQKLALWEESTRVPMIISVPDALGNGRRSPRIVELLDLYPTIAELAGLAPPSHVEGRSLAPLLENPKAENWNHGALSQIGDGRSVRFGDWRYTEWGKDGVKGRELYNLRDDPGEYRNLAHDAQFAEVILRLKEMLPGEPPPSTGPKLPSEQEVLTGRK
ncbi:MAG: sulfatase [Novosphingobium sp.]|nr:sulfatase [Novosphingobium sp.]MCP5400865.1 sulfatase [Novosphingobium sp.]